jgi:hypothetical protein
VPNYIKRRLKPDEIDMAIDHSEWLVQHNFTPQAEVEEPYTMLDRLLHQWTTVRVSPHEIPLPSTGEKEAEERDTSHKTLGATKRPQTESAQYWMMLVSVIQNLQIAMLKHPPTNIFLDGYGLDRT